MNVNVEVPLFLVGLPGSGKTFFGQLLAKELDYKFIDLDYYIELEEGSSVENLLSSGKESEFRKKEQVHLRSLLDRESVMVISTGGGTPCFHDNMALMNDSGITIYLSADPEYIVTHIREDASVRPLFKTEYDLTDQVVYLLEKRRNFYEMAQITIRVDDKNPDDCLKEMVRKVIAIQFNK